MNRAARHLKKRDRVLRRIIEQAGPCQLKPRRGYFQSLCKAIISQQLATAAAKTIHGRFAALFDRKRPTPAGLLSLRDSELRGVGLSRQKMSYLQDLARKFDSGQIPRGLSRMDDEAIITALTQVKGVGVWTVQMFLIFVLNRPDVLPVDDLGIRKAIQKHYGYDELPTAAEMTETAACWRPYRSVACWYLWRSLDNSPA